MQVKYAVISALGLLPYSLVAKADYIVATNLPPSETYSDSWDGVGVNSEFPVPGYTNRAAGQTFSASSGGTLTTVDALMAAGSEQPVPNSPPLNISIYNSVNNLPTTLLGTVQKNASDFNVILNFPSLEHRYSFDFSQFHIALTTGGQYFIAFQTPTGVAGLTEDDSPYFVGLELSSRNQNPPLVLETFASVRNDGIIWEPDTGNELAIKVHAVPEPNRAYILAAGALATCLTLRPARSRTEIGLGAGKKIPFNGQK